MPTEQAQMQEKLETRHSRLSNMSFLGNPVQRQLSREFCILYHLSSPSIRLLSACHYTKSNGEK